jgi:hypothetical protein
MLTPQYSVRHLLVAVTLAAVVCLVPAMAARGHDWAIALSVALYGAVVLLLTVGLLCAATRASGALVRRARLRAEPDAGRH